ncbi:MAG: hypothetical protein IJR29_12575 [Butyrivibrio sp.]|nr:hypothetical protein [Butyrivibrio sp.]
MENKLGKKIHVCYGLLFFITGIIVFCFSFLMGKSYEAILRNTIVSLIIAGTDVYMLLDAFSRGKEAYAYDNYDHKFRFVFAYIVILIMSCVFSLVPNLFWPYMALFVILGLFSNNEIGIVSGTGFVIISVLLEESGVYGELFMYAIAGMLALALFRDLKENTAIGYPTAISLMIQAVLLLAFNVLFQNRTLSIGLLIVPILNIMFNLIILMVFLNIFGVYIIRKSNDMYMEINDTNYPLLIRLKEQSIEDYYRAIHTGSLAERIALELGINNRAVKTCSYYHGIGVLENKKKWEDVKHFYEENHFPIEAQDYLREYIAPEKGHVKSKECLAVRMTETVIISIQQLFKQDKNAKIDYEKLIDDLFDKMISDGKLNDYNVTFREYEVMRKILKKEKLYYDFLR